MEFRSFAISGPLEIIPRKIVDERGYFSELFRLDAFAREVGGVEKSSVIVPTSRKSAAGIPQTISRQTNAHEKCVSKQSRNASVSIQERVDPHQAVMRSRERDECLRWCARGK